MPHTELNLSDEGAIQTDALLRELIVSEAIGEGGFGRAYTAHFRGRPLVVKLPVDLVKTPPPRNTKKRGRALEKLLKPPEQVPDFIWVRAYEAFKKECQNAEKVLDPYEERRIRNGRTHKAGAPLLWSQLTPADQDVIREARQRWKAEPGYVHMHPVLHLDRKIPLLLSEPARYNLYGASFVLEPHQPLPRKWIAVARQLADAVDFLRRCTHLAHLDIKPHNVFYNLDTQTNLPHIWLGDYGLMQPQDEPCAFNAGTPAYMPPPRLFTKLTRAGFTNDQEQLFGYYVTLLDLICFRNNAGAVEFLSQNRPYVSEALLEAIAQPEHALFAHAPPELFANVMVPLFDASLHVLDVLFERTRAWLRTLP
jgi:serine/threonine protein kinase